MLRKIPHRAGSNVKIHFFKHYPLNERRLRRISEHPLLELQQEYRALAARLAQTGYITHGSVFERRKGAGSRYQWTWKNKAQKTESLTLTSREYSWLKEASRNHRELNKTLAKMRRLSIQIFNRQLRPKTKSQTAGGQRSRA